MTRTIITNDYRVSKAMPPEMSNGQIITDFRLLWARRMVGSLFGIPVQAAKFSLLDHQAARARRFPLVLTIVKGAELCEPESLCAL
jgi:hypothetical protein